MSEPPISWILRFVRTWLRVNVKDAITNGAFALSFETGGVASVMSPI